VPARDALLRFRKSVWFRVLYVAILAFLISPLLLAFPLSLLLVPGTMAVIPYYLRERGYRKYIGNGLVVLAGAILIVAAFSSASVVGRESAPVLEGSAGGVDLTNGTVVPYRGAPGQTFLFSVDLRTSSPVSPGNVQVWLNLSYLDLTGRFATVVPAPRMVADSPADLNFTDGKRYVVSQVAAYEVVYFFGFSALVNVSSSQVFARTPSDGGPSVIGFGQYFVVFVLLAANYALYPAPFYFLGLGLFWLYRRGQRQRAAVARPKEEPAAETAGGTYTCTNCGASVSDEDQKCPSCGAVFEVEPEMPSVERIPPKTEGRDGEP